MKKILAIAFLMVTNLTLGQSKYPLQTVFRGDSVVILTKEQAVNINKTFDMQREKLQKADLQIATQHRVIDSLQSIINSTDANYEELQTLYTELLIFTGYLETWITERAKEGAWIYYSYDSLWIEAVDLSEYNVRKDNVTGDIFFYRIAVDCPKDNKRKNEYPRRGWDREVVLPNRPKINKL